MAYEPVPSVLTREPGTPAAERAIRQLLEDLASRKEFRAFAVPVESRGASARAQVPGFVPSAEGVLHLPGLRLSGGQHFVANLVNPDTEYERLLINWQTGVGKSIGAAAIGRAFVAQYRAAGALGGRSPSVFVISFLARETIQEDMLRYPEFGFVTAREVEALRAQRLAAATAGAASVEARQLASFTGVLRRRITDRDRGGYYRFYGYKEFASQLFAVTPQGVAKGFDVLALYSQAAAASGEAAAGEGGGAADEFAADEFAERLQAAVVRGDVRVNEALLEDLRGGLLIADEIPNTYNIAEKNNYGVAIQYALDRLGADAPRTVVMSATPMTGSAGEVVDLLNFLVPRRHLPSGRPLRRADFFARVAAAGVGAGAGAGAAEGEPQSRAAAGPRVSQLRPGALARIAHLAAGRVSYMLDADRSAYPRRRFEGAPDAEAPYLKLTSCPMAPYHERALAQEQAAAGKAPAAGLAADAYALYDMVWPNPAEAPDASSGGPPGAGLYRSGEVLARLAQAPDEWKAAAGVAVVAGPAPSIRVATGPYLERGRVAAISEKYAQLVERVIARLRAGPGKLMVYHHRVRSSGVLQIAELFRMNGFADEASAPTDATLCSVCGAPRGGHPPAAAGHEYEPARYVLAHSAVDLSVRSRSVARYNSTANLYGYAYRLLIASKVLREGISLRGVRWQWLASFPTDYPTLIQIFGRVARRGSHADLPEDQRDVTYTLLVSTYRDGRPSPELQRYRDKGREFLVIQEVERALHQYATDSFLHEERIQAALRTSSGAGPSGPIQPSLDALPFVPALGREAARALPVRTATFEAYGHGAAEVVHLAGVCRQLFRARPVWTRADLWAAVRSGAVLGAGRDPASYDEDNFAAALVSLGRPVGDPATAVVPAGRFYVQARVGPGGRPDLDVEAHLRPAGADAPGVAVRVADFLRVARAGQSFAARLKAFEEAYLGPAPASPLEAALVEFGAAFHEALLRRLVPAQFDPGERVTSDDPRVLALYRRFRVLVTVADAAAPAAKRVYRGGPAGPPTAGVGYLTATAVALYDPKAREWYSAPHADFGVGHRQRENDVVVGFVAAAGTSAGAGAGAVEAPALFKVRPPMQALRQRAAASAEGSHRVDLRGLARGAVCATRPREELEAVVARLRKEVARAGLAPRVEGGFAGDLPPQLSYAAKFDRAALRRFPSATELCDTLRLCLLALEEAARAPADGMLDGLRWLYLFHDRPPSVAASVGAV